MVNIDELIDELEGATFDNDGVTGTIEEVTNNQDYTLDIETDTFSTEVYISELEGYDDLDDAYDFVIESVEETASERNNGDYWGN